MRNQSEPPSLAAIKTPISQEAFDQLFRDQGAAGVSGTRVYVESQFDDRMRS